MNERDLGQLTPLMLAARNGHSNCIMALVKDLGAGWNVGVLIALGCTSRTVVDVTATDFNGFTVLHWLASNGRAAPLELLLNDGFDISTQDRHSRVYSLT
jgi:ankyrin repeat protein